MSAPLRAPSFPDDAHAVIYKPCRAATTSGKRRTRDWKLRFERRSAPFIEPLMGWTGGDDPLTQIELSFASAEAAAAYARRQGLPYTVRGLPKQAPRLRLASNTNGPLQKHPCHASEAMPAQICKRLERAGYHTVQDEIGRGVGAPSFVLN